MLLRIFYTSTATCPMSHEGLEALLAQSREANARSAISGALLYHDRSFFQALEGPEPALRALWTKIERDPRHHAVHVFLEQRPAERLFGDWTMAWAAPRHFVAPGFDAAQLRSARHGDDELQAMLDSFRRAVRLV
ncbi:MAG: BLUF domain-containing protein [Candidatus Sericytochromatia bacterium]|nr:BLUF domain-containing protein [Candidatus Sericytochromatia bacterium]